MMMATSTMEMDVAISAQFKQGITAMEIFNKYLSACLQLFRFVVIIHLILKRNIAIMV